MNQSFDTELQVVLRALSEVVLPALDGADKHVVEQLQLSMAALNFMRERLPHAGRFYRSELASFTQLADAAADLVVDGTVDAEGLHSHATAARALVQDPTADWADYIDATHLLREAIADVVEHSVGALHEAALDGLIVAASTDLHLQSRVWCQPFGFELKPEDLPRPTWTRSAG